MSNKYVKVVDSYMGDLYFPSHDSIIAPRIEQGGIWEQDEFSAILNNVNPGDVCLNVGAHVGYFTCLLSKVTGSEGIVYSIEANPDFEKYIKKNVESVAYDNVNIISAAAGSSTGQINLYVNDSNTGDNRVFSPESIENPLDTQLMTCSQVINVKLDTVDNLIGSTALDFVLIDCQGYDHHVVRGMKKSLQLKMPKIILEFTPNFITALGEKPIDILNEYQSLGFDIYIYRDNVSFEKVSTEELMSFLYDDIVIEYINLFLAPEGESWK